MLSLRDDLAQRISRIQAISDQLVTRSCERESRQSITGNAERMRNMTKAVALGTHEQWQWWRLLGFYGRQCCRCGSKARIAKDHIRPVSRGGSDGLDNLQPLCQGCNSRKLARWEDYRWDNGEWVGVVELGWLVGE